MNPRPTGLNAFSSRVFDVLAGHLVSPWRALKDSCARCHVDPLNLTPELLRKLIPHLGLHVLRVTDLECAAQVESELLSLALAPVEPAPPQVRVVLIDDSEVVLEVVGAQLAAAGMQVTPLLSAVDNTGVIVSARPDVILLDLDMPQLSGEGAARVMKRQRALENIKIILHSGSDEAVLEEAVRRCGADGWLKKTDDANELVSAVRRLAAA